MRRITSNVSLHARSMLQILIAAGCRGASIGSSCRKAVTERVLQPRTRDLSSRWSRAYIGERGRSGSRDGGDRGHGGMLRDGRRG